MAKRKGPAHIRPALQSSPAGGALFSAFSDWEIDRGQIRDIPFPKVVSFLNNDHPGSLETHLKSR
jgi:hypothetical protein